MKFITALVVALCLVVSGLTFGTGYANDDHRDKYYDKHHKKRHKDKQHDKRYKKRHKDKQHKKRHKDKRDHRD